jgi:hypothetical protein
MLSSAQADVKYREKKVEVTSPFKYVKGPDGKTEVKALPYLKRRPNWGVRLNFATSEIELNKETDGKKDGTPFQIDININRNYSFFSIGPEIGFTSAKFENTASFTGFSLGLGVYLDGLSDNTYVVPFASAGVISISGDVDQIDPADASGAIKNFDIDAKDVVPYYRAGVLIGLNWIDKRTAFMALSDYGLQNSFIYIAMRKITSTAAEDGVFDLETKLYLEYGLQLEF